MLRDRAASRVHIRHARGSTARPMTDSELDAKFRGQVCTELPDADVERLIGRLRTVVECADVATWLLR
ncbi:hypothetical protein GCM10011320_34090 [Neoroseomonas lacus]|uniref:Uncharacterized protein n=1 Tax=Neoroseomonas lacus TaxID=287609 RepID=A0A917KPZ3_9PROT|nr:hypothetical protein GCM10011320_34090 [Neoroseomonas lacus]